MTTKSQLQDLVSRRSGETEIARFLKDNLHLLGEHYNMPSGEYICFSELSIGNGFVDFAVLTGRSRMDVHLIEVKGAEFRFLAANGNISAKVNEGIQQVRRRLGEISETLEEYRQAFHRRRDKAETVKNNSNLLVGPRTPLHVDPNKDVYFYGSVIGGYSRDVNWSCFPVQFFGLSKVYPVC